MTIDIQIEHVRRIELATFSLAPGSRTILIGKNNVGKTTLLETIARALWSLPCKHSADQYRGFSTSWYRRNGGSFLRPKVTISFPASTLSADIAVAGTALRFELIGNTSATPLREDNHTSTQLVVVGVTASRDRQDRGLATMREPLNAASDVLTGQTLEVSTVLLSDMDWTPLDAQRTGSRIDVTPQSLYDANTPLSRSLRDFLGRVLYLAANRVAAFSPDRAFDELSQSQMSGMTPLLLRLNTVNRSALEGLSTALGLIFPEVRALRFAGLGGSLVPEIEFGDGRTEQVANMGFGFQNALQVLTVVTMAQPNSIILIDEPEKGLNQSSQRDLASLLEVLRPDITLVVSTQAEAFCRGFSSSASIVLVEADGNAARTERVNITRNHADLRRLAYALGLDPIYLSEGGKIVYVEGVSDQLIVEQWIKLQFPSVSGYQVVSLGGCGKISEEFVKPLLVAYRDRVFLLLDSDRPSKDVARSSAIERLASWLVANTVDHFILERREIENYIGADPIARAAGLHPSVLSAVPGTADWHDIKAAFEREKGHRYDERRFSVEAFNSLDGQRRLELFETENAGIREKLRVFLGV